MSCTSLLYCKRKALPSHAERASDLVDLRGPYYNTNTQVADLERLVKQLPKPSSTPESFDLPRKRPRTAKQLSAEQTAQLIAGYSDGANLRKLAAEFGIHPDTAGLILRREGITMRPKSLTPEQITEARQLYEAGWSSVRIGERLGFNGTTIVTTLRKHGVRIRDAQGRDT